MESYDLTQKIIRLTKTEMLSLAEILEELNCGKRFFWQKVRQKELLRLLDELEKKQIIKSIWRNVFDQQKVYTSDWERIEQKARIDDDLLKEPFFGQMHKHVQEIGLEAAKEIFGPTVWNMYIYELIKRQNRDRHNRADQP
jgi:hypothetical protein